MAELAFGKTKENENSIPQSGFEVLKKSRRLVYSRRPRSSSRPLSDNEDYSTELHWPGSTYDQLREDMTLMLENVLKVLARLLQVQ